MVDGAVLLQRGLVTFSLPVFSYTFSYEQQNMLMYICNVCVRKLVMWALFRYLKPELTTGSTRGESI